MDRRVGTRLRAGSLAVSLLVAATVGMPVVALSTSLPSDSFGVGAPSTGLERASSRAERGRSEAEPASHPTEPVTSRIGTLSAAVRWLSTRTATSSPVGFRSTRVERSSSTVDRAALRPLRPTRTARVDRAIRTAGAAEARTRASADQGALGSSLVHPEPNREPAAVEEPGSSSSGASEPSGRSDSSGGSDSGDSPDSSGGSESSGGSSFRGVNHFWYPALGMSQSVVWFPCERSTPPGAPTYRWGCAGSNNVYLMAHDYGNFNALYRAYYRGALDPGELAVYADGDGDIHYFRLAWYKVAPPTTDAAWAWASQSRSSMTLQTCVGENDSLRLFVRFVEVGAP